MKVTILMILCAGITASLKAQSLTGSNWVLQGIYTGTRQNELKDTLFVARLFFSTDSTYEGSFCNQYQGQYSRVRKRLIMERPSATKRFCSALGEQEQRLFCAYVEVRRYKIKGNRLTLVSASGHRLVFRKQ